jgi:predicted amidohydrolase
MVQGALRVAAVQFEPRLHRREENVARLLTWTRAAFAEGARLVVLPEMATSGYCFYDRADVAPLAETVPGPSTEAFAELCRAADGVVVLGLPEVDPATGVFYNTVAVVGRNGLLGRYRKIHSWISEPRWAMDGDLGPVVVDTPAGRIGLLDCMDIEYPELARALQILGAELLAFPTNWLGERSPSAVWWSTARFTGLPLVAANRIGVERRTRFSGGSAVFDGDGRLLASRDDDEGLVLADVGPPRRTAATAPPPPEALTPLALSSHLFDPHDFFRLYGRRDLPPGGTTTVAALPWRGRLRDLPIDTPADVLLLPEFALGRPGESPPFTSADEAALVDACRRHGRRVALGVLEPGPSSTLLLVGPDGVLARRTRPLDGDPGFEPTLVNLPAARVALLFGRELETPERTRLAAVAGADLLLVADAGTERVPLPHPGSRVDLGGRVPTGPDPHHFSLVRVRATTDDVYVAYASAEAPPAAYGPTFDLCGTVDPGGVRLVVRTGRVLAGRPNPCRYKFHLQKRRPDAYRALWSPR